MSPSMSPVPTSTIDIHPPETQALTPPSNTLPASPSLDESAPAMTPHTPCNLPVLRWPATLHLNGCMDNLETSAHALLGWIIVVQGVLRGPTQKDFIRGPASKQFWHGSALLAHIFMKNQCLPRLAPTPKHVAEESEADEDDDDIPSKCRKKPGKRRQKNYLHDAFHKYLEEKGVKKRRKDLMLPKSAPPDSVREFNATNNHPLTLSDLMIDWSSSLLAPGWNTKVVQLLTVDFQQRLKNGTYPFVVFDEGKMNLLELHKLCIEKLCCMPCEKQDGAKLDTTDITAHKERCHKLNRMTTRKHGTLVQQRRIIDENHSRDPDTWDDIRRIIDHLDIEGISGNKTDTAPGTQPKVVRHMVLPWLSPFISELFDCVESYNTALHEERMTVHTGNSSLECMFEPCCMDTKAVAVIFRAAQVNSASPEPTPDQVHFLRLLSLRFSTFPPSP
ncbi:hypothetical protein PAXRUDRAFT_14891 [Paxillus rubicundulus Ve08.2h10]|uniref:Uncharacterized protein n=1 Tax=Paxillus rubicundulus Ve08.2h10 TaxID=930991 RepID=A0A0D0DCZ2_9AGAM|nr:hypothetical protein PAXRUDRAFT_14891 [Paxillus rubicundulus Ve08.2h10]